MKRWTLLMLGAAGCFDTGASEIAVPLEVAGSGERTLESDDGFVVTLDRAEVAFGPLYLCSGTRAGELCDTARAEWIGSVVVDALAEEPVRAGVLEGTAGVARSWMYDHGIVSLYTQPAPVVLEAAAALGGYSIVVEGTAEQEGVRVAFVARVPIRQEEETEQGIPVVRRSGSDPFEHEITGLEARLLVRFDPRPWLAGVDYTALAAEGEEVAVAPESQAFRAIRNAVVAGPRPTFTWSTRP